MHHPDPEGDSGGSGSVGKMAIFPRTGSISSGGGSGPVATLSTQAANAVVNNVNNSHVLAVDDYQSSLLFQSQTPAGTSSPAPQQHPPPPQSLNLLPPSCAQSAGVQMKKKSGFQITSVTPAQISVSTNNSIAEDTESYDDLDESHTEDLSSSEILDVSLSRANDIGGADRSSSEETLNNFHEAETPGAISPNQPSHPHALNQVSQHGGTLVNGTVHHLHHQHQQQYHHPQGQHHMPQAQSHPASSGHGAAPAALPSGAIHSVAQKMPSNLGAGKENISVGPLNVTAQPAGPLAPGSVPGMHSAATGTTISIVNPLTSNVSNVNMLSSANVPMKRAVGTSASGGSGGAPPSVISRSAAGGSVAMGGALTSNPKVNSGITAAASASGVMGPSGGTQGGVGSALTHPGGGPSAQSAAPTPISSTLSQPAPAPTTTTTTTTTSSRFRVVKLDSSSEPFKKGRWLCTEYYDKVESTPNVPTSLSSAEAACPPSGPRPGESARQFTHETFAGGSERDSTSGGSVSSTVSTLSHYTESVGSGDAGGGAVVHQQQQPQDYAPAAQGFQAPLAAGGLSMGASHSQPHMHGQDLAHAHLKTTMAPSAPGSIHHQPVSMTGHQTTVGYSQPGVAPQQLTYAQAVASPPPDATHGLVGGQHQQQQQQQQHMGYTSLPQQPCATSQAAQVQVRPPEYTHAHPGAPQTQQTLSHQAGMMPGAGPGNGAGHMMAVPQQQQAVNSMPSQQQPQILLQGHPQQISSLQGAASAMGPQMGVGGLNQQPPSHTVAPDQQQQQSLQAQIQSSQAAASCAPPSNTQGDPQAQAHNGANSGGIAPQNQLPRAWMAQDASAHVHTQTAQALYANLPNFTTTQLVDAQRLLLQHQSALLGLPISGGGGAQGHGAEGGAASVSALTASAGLLKTVDGEEDSSSGASVVAIDNKIEQAMDLVKSHLMYAVREEVEVLKEQIKELIERNSQLEQENTLLKTLASPEQMAQFQAQVQTTTSSPPATTGAVAAAPVGTGVGAPPQGALPTAAAPPQQQLPVSHNSGASA